MIIDIVIMVFLLYLLTLSIIYAMAVLLAIGFSLYLLGFMLYHCIVDPQGIWR